MFKFTIGALFLSYSMGAVAAENQQNEAGTSGPSQVCMKLVESAKANKFESFSALATNFGPHGHSKKDKPMAAERFDKMHEKFMDKIKQINCGTEHVAGNNAFVEAETGGSKRFIPFVKVDKDWKFDAKTYMSFYDYSGQGPKGTGAKKYR